MSMMSAVHASMTVTGDLARVERMQAEVTELDAEILAEALPVWRSLLRRRRRLLCREIDRIMSVHALRVARAS